MITETSTRVAPSPQEIAETPHDVSIPASIATQSPALVASSLDLVASNLLNVPDPSAIIAKSAGVTPALRTCHFLLRWNAEKKVVSATS